MPLHEKNTIIDNFKDFTFKHYVTRSSNFDHLADPSSMDIFHIQQLACNSGSGSVLMF